MELVRNNINSILYYMIGQRFRQENFGNRLWECIEEPNSQALSFIIKEFIKTAIGTWEQRLTFKGIKVARVDAKVNIEVEYSINGTGSSQYLYLTYNNLDNSLNTNNMGITNKWLNPYQRSYQQIKAKLIESLMGIKDREGNVLITDYSEGNILIIILSLLRLLPKFFITTLITWQGKPSYLLPESMVQ